MPQLRLNTPAVDTIMLPNSGVHLSVRQEITGRDKAEATAVAVKMRRDGFDGPQVYMRYLCALAANMIVEWDAEDADGRPIPISPQMLGLIEDRADYEFIVDHIAGKMQAAGVAQKAEEEEPPFDQPSTSSSEDTSSPTPQSSPT